MNRFKTGVSLVALALACGATLVSTAAAAPSIHVEPEVLNFGTMQQNETRTGEVVITNQGDAPLHIEDVKTSCGCTAAAPETDLLEPGASTSLRIDFNSKKFQGDQTKTVRILTNDPQQQEAHVYVEAFIKVPLMTEPPQPRLAFPPVKQGDTDTREFRFTAPDVDELEVSLVRHDPDLFDIEVVDHYEGDPKRAALKITVPADMPTGRQRDVIRVATNVPEQPTLDIDLAATIVEEIRVHPDRLRLRYLKPGQTVNSYVRLSPYSQALTFDVKSAEIDIPGLEVSVDVMKPHREYSVRVSGSALAKDHQLVASNNGRVSGTLRIETTAEKQPLIEIPVTYMIRL